MNIQTIIDGIPEYPDACWNWDRGDNQPRIHYEGRMQYVNRLAYRFHVGPVKPSDHVWRTCENSRCFNPAHLKKGSEKEHGKYVLSLAEKTLSHIGINAEVDLHAYFANLQSMQGLTGTDVVRYYGDMMRFERFAAVWKMNRDYLYENAKEAIGVVNMETGEVVDVDDELEDC